jgi:archaemetzincin
MTNLTLVCLAFQECSLLTSIQATLSKILSSTVFLRKDEIEIDNFFNADRGQYDAAAILSLYEKKELTGRIIIITSVDLYIPIFTFVFGLAKLEGTIGIVSAHRLKSEYYGLPPDEDLLKSRLVKEIIHELGHLLNLRHCPDYHCVMASSNTADELDIKGSYFCNSCLDKISDH